MPPAVNQKDEQHSLVALFEAMYASDAAARVNCWMVRPGQKHFV